MGNFGLTLGTAYYWNGTNGVVNQSLSSPIFTAGVQSIQSDAAGMGMYSSTRFGYLQSGVVTAGYSIEPPLLGVAPGGLLAVTFVKYYPRGRAVFVWDTYAAQPPVSHRRPPCIF